MKLLMTADTVGGVWTYALELARALEPAGVAIDLATMGAPLSVAQRHDVHVARNITLHESTFRLEWMRDPWGDVMRAGEWLLRLERRIQPDVVHLNGFAHGALPWSAPTIVVGHSCVLSWWHAVHGGSPDAAWDRYRSAVAHGLHGADRVVTPTAAMLCALRSHYRFRTPAQVVPNGCAAAEQPRSTHAGGHTRPPVILAAGRLWDEAKNMTTLADAARTIRWPVHVAGCEARPDGGRHALDGLHALGLLPPHVLRTWYARAGIFVHPALYEPFGLAPLEAALAGCALVLGNIPSLHEVWGDAAVFVPPRDAAALADAVNTLGADRRRLAERADAAQRRARTYTAERMGSAYHELYRSLAARAAGSGREVCACAS